MKPTILLLGLFGALLLTSMISAEAFNINEYLFDDESIDNVNYVDVEIDNENYTMVYIGDNPIFILKDGELVEDKILVESLACDCWEKLYYPSEEEINELKGYIEDYNAGRHGEVQYKAPPLHFSDAEGYCDKATYMNQEVFEGHMGCIGEEECVQLANLFCNMIDPTHQMGCDPYVLGDGFTQYSEGKYGMNKYYGETIELFNDLDSSNIAERLDIYEEKLADLKNAGEDLVYNDLRLPVGNVYSCETCVGFCPEIPLDFELLEKAQEKVDELQEKVKPLENEAEKIQLIADNTEDRIWYSKGKDLYPLYNSKYSTALNENQGTLEWAEDTLGKVVNGNLANKYNSAKLLKDNLETQLQTYRFEDNFEQQIEQLKIELNALEELKNENLTTAYDKAEDARLKATNKLIRARWYVDETNENLIAELNEAGSLYNQYQAGYITPLSDAQYESQEIRFNEVSQKLDNVISKSPGAGGSLSGTVKKANNEVTKTAYSLIGASMNEDKSLLPIIPAIVLVSINFVLIALSVFIFVKITKSNRAIFRKKIVLTSWIIVLILFIGILIIGSIAVYSMITGNYGAGDYGSFEYSLRDSDTINIVIDERGAETYTILSMDKCADLVRLQLNNKNIKEYRFSGTQCASPNGIRSIEECELEFGLTPTYVFEYNTEKSGYSFQNTYGNDAKTFGTKDIFDKCEIGYAIYLGE
ncbi:MAG: hypothetical protein WC356_06860 [Candidatus Micrarchaeia archaeon]|jgi:hypothetical protein